MEYLSVEVDPLPIGYVDSDGVEELHMGLEPLAIGKIAHYGHIGCNFYTKCWWGNCRSHLEGVVHWLILH